MTQGACVVCGAVFAAVGSPAWRLISLFADRLGESPEISGQWLVCPNHFPPEDSPQRQLTRAYQHVFVALLHNVAITRVAAKAKT